MTYHAKVIAGAKMVIPANIRRELGIKGGDSLVVTQVSDGSLSVRTFDQVIRDNQRGACEILPDYTVDQFLAERRSNLGEE